MTPKERALYLVEKFWTQVRDYNLSDSSISKIQAIQSALIAVDEILELICCMDGKEHYEQVKHEIEKI